MPATQPANGKTGKRRFTPPADAAEDKPDDSDTPEPGTQDKPAESKDSDELEEWLEKEVDW